jgi:prolipoprotein diacylglyceryltransferase
MTTNHFVLNHTKLATFRNIESMLGARNRILLEFTKLNNNGIQIHGGLVLHILTIITNGVQRVFMMTTHSTRSNARNL